MPRTAIPDFAKVRHVTGFTSNALPAMKAPATCEATGTISNGD
jgi:hypothetical protein